MDNTQPHPLSLAEARYILGGERWRMDSEYQPLLRLLERNDADPTNALALQLEQVKNKVIEHEYERTEALGIIPVSTELSPMMDTFSWAETLEVGDAKIIALDAVTDLPTVETFGKKNVHTQVAIANAYKYSMWDVQRAAVLGMSLDARKAIAARRAAEYKLDDLVATGAADAGIPSGFLNNSNVNNETLSANFGAGFQTDLTELNDFANAFDDQLDDMAGQAELILPRSWFRTLSQQRASVDNGESTLEAFLRANPWVTRVRTWKKLETSGPSGVKQAVLWTPNADTAEMHVSRQYGFTPPERKGLGFQVAGYLQTAGTTVYKPLHMRYLYGV